MNFFKKLNPLIDPLVGRTIIKFTTHGCQATIHEFEWVGKIVDVDNNRGDWYYNKTWYKVQILKDKTGWEQRNNIDQEEKKFDDVPSWYIQDLGGMLVTYD